MLQKEKPARKRTLNTGGGGAAFIRKTLAEFSSKGKIQRELVKDYAQRLIEREVETVDKSRVEKLKQTIETLTVS